MENFTTTLATYTIEKHTQRRVDRFEDGVAVWIEYPQFNILKDGKMLCFCYDEADIAGVIDCQERPERYAGMNNRFD